MQSIQSTFEIRQLDRGIDSWTDEAVVLIDGRDQLASLGRTGRHRGSGWIGLHPSDALGPDSSLLPGHEPHDAYVARCDCSELGCSALIARISQNADQVIWDSFRRGSDARADEQPVDGEPFVFDRYDYKSAVLGEEPLRSDWQPTTRRAALIVNESVRGMRDEDLRLKVAGCGHVNDEEVLLQAFFGTRGDPDRAMLRRVMRMEDNETATALADRIVRYLTTGSILHDTEVVRRAF